MSTRIKFDPSYQRKFYDLIDNPQSTHEKYLIPFGENTKLEDQNQELKPCHKTDTIIV